MKKQIGIFTAILFAVSTLMVSCSPEVHTHTFAEEWKTDENFHWKECECGEIKFDAEHAFGEWKVTKEPTEEAKGSKERVCDVCKYKETAEIAQLNHKHVAGESWKNDYKNHWKECIGCKEKLESAEHEYEWTTKAATCTEEGSKTGVCKVCKKEITEKIDAKGHSYSGRWTKDASGHWYECVCGEKKDFEEHTYDIWKVVQKPTASTEGTSKSECKICSFEETKQIIPIPEGFVFVQGGTIEGAINTSDYAGVFIEGRTVTLSDFYMGKYEVTQEEYASVMAGQKVTVNGTEYALESNPSDCTADSTRYTLFSGDVQEKRPVEEVTWYDAVWYCNALSEKEGLTKAYNIEVTQIVHESGKYNICSICSANVTLNKNATGYRLPTEAEWEYAARGGDPTKDDWNYLFSGADTAEGVAYYEQKNSGLDSVGWYWFNSKNGTTGDTTPSDGEQGYGTHQVGKKASNRLGLYDMSGNVEEWCWDWYGGISISDSTPADGVSSGSRRVIRGGCWGYDARYAAVANRGSSSDPGNRYYNLGFRVVRPSSK